MLLSRTTHEWSVQAEITERELRPDQGYSVLVESRLQKVTHPGLRCITSGLILHSSGSDEIDWLRYWGSPHRAHHQSSLNWKPISELDMHASSVQPALMTPDEMDGQMRVNTPSILRMPVLGDIPLVSF
jgi:hypothetical protein